MHSRISEFPNKFIYKGKLIDKTCDEKLKPLIQVKEDSNSYQQLQDFQNLSRSSCQQTQQSSQPLNVTRTLNLSQSNNIFDKKQLSVIDLQSTESKTITTDHGLSPHESDDSKSRLAVQFINLKDAPEIRRSDSYTNPAEAQLISRLVLQTMMRFVHNSNYTVTQQQTIPSIGLITPYSAQKRLLETHIGRNIPNFNNNLNIVNLFNLRIDTVDGFQGMERDIIFFSSVRSNNNGNLGFLNDIRRFNVMATRAKRNLIVVGNEKTLLGSESDRIWSNLSENSNLSVWNKWIKWVRKRGTIIEIDPMEVNYNSCGDIGFGMANLISDHQMINPSLINSNVQTESDSDEFLPEYCYDEL